MMKQMNTMLVCRKRELIKLTSGFAWNGRMAWHVGSWHEGNHYITSTQLRIFYEIKFPFSIK